MALFIFAQDYAFVNKLYICGIYEWLLKIDKNRLIVLTDIFKFHLAWVRIGNTSSYQDSLHIATATITKTSHQNKLVYVKEQNFILYHQLKIGFPSPEFFYAP